LRRLIESTFSSWVTRRSMQFRSVNSVAEAKRRSKLSRRKWLELQMREIKFPSCLWPLKIRKASSHSYEIDNAIGLVVMSGHGVKAYEKRRMESEKGMRRAKEPPAA
jgi:hypothetical protein